jgi:uncharacterized hydrophobic protein (TIGR00341 family)
MPLRLVEAKLPESPEGIQDALGDVQVVDYWVVGTTDGWSSVRILVDTERTEALADRLRERYSETDLRLVLLAVEATIPPVEEEAGAGEGADGAPTTPGRISREELHQDIVQASRLTPVWAAMVFLSTVVAAVGLIRGDVAIIIGAMVIAPLLGPNMALALAVTLGDVDLARSAGRTIAAGLLIAGLSSVLMGLAFPIDPTVSDIAGRTRAGLGDIALALSAGAAGTLAFTGGLPGALVGVMVAVALLPPLAVAGLLAGAGYAEGAVGALILVGTNVACINLAAVGTFLIQKVRPRSWWEADRARGALRIAISSWLLLLAALAALIIFGDVGLDIR